MHLGEKEQQLVCLSFSVHPILQRPPLPPVSVRTSDSVFMPVAKSRRVSCRRAEGGDGGAGIGVKRDSGLLRRSVGLHAAAQVSMKLAGESEDRLPWESPTPLDDGIRESLLENDPRMSPALDAADIEGAEEGAPSSDATLVGLTRLGGVSRSPRLPSRYLHHTNMESTFSFGTERTSG